MHIKGSDIAHTLGLKTDQSFNRSEVYSVGMRTMGPPVDFLVSFHAKKPDTNIKTSLSEDRDTDAYDVWDGNDDAIKCLSCQSPEAIDRCVGIKKERFPGTNVWFESAEYVAPLCADCNSTKVANGSGGYVGVTMPPPSGDISTHFVKDNVSRSRSAGHIRNRGITRKFTRYVK